MQICVAAGTGEGPTALAAFDAALLQAGIANYNLIPLSSVIPPGAAIQRRRYVTPPDDYGNRLFVVLARHDEHEIGGEAWAGLAWTQEPTTGRGLFVEGHGPSEHAVAEYMEATLESMIASREYPYGPIHNELIGITCRSHPVCAIVVAVYGSEGWPAKSPISPEL